MNTTSLTQALAKLATTRAKIATVRTAIAKDAEELQDIQDQISAFNLQVAQLRVRSADKALHAKLAEIERVEVEDEETAIEALNVMRAGEIVRRQAADPVGEQEWVIEHVMQLRESVRSEFNTKITDKYRTPPLITQALNLLPPLDPLDKRMSELGHVQVGHTDWATRRKAILAAHVESFNPPLEAA